MSKNSITILIHHCHKFLDIIYVTSMDVVYTRCFKQKKTGQWIMSEITVIVKLFLLVTSCNGVRIPMIITPEVRHDIVT
jgi:hypothetical protein